jgi:LemA protein
MSTSTIVLLVIVAAVVIYLWVMYNGLATLRVRIKEALSGIDVQLKRRTDLIPNLVETVKGYAKHEKSVFEDVTKARSALMKADGPAQKAAANNMLEGALKSLFAVAEAYPELKASDNFKQLQVDLTDTEDKIAYSRQFYNGNVRDYNSMIVTFPNVFLARMFGFTQEEFFAATDEERKKVEVKF